MSRALTKDSQAHWTSIRSPRAKSVSAIGSKKLGEYTSSIFAAMKISGNATETGVVSPSMRNPSSTATTPSRRESPFSPVNASSRTRSVRSPFRRTSCSPSAFSSASSSVRTQGLKNNPRSPFSPRIKYWGNFSETNKAGEKTEKASKLKGHDDEHMERKTYRDSAFIPPARHPPSHVRPENFFKPL
jgi:hypothetical protein